MAEIVRAELIYKHLTWPVGTCVMPPLNPATGDNWGATSFWTRHFLRVTTCFSHSASSALSFILLDSLSIVDTVWNTDLIAMRLVQRAQLRPSVYQKTYVRTRIKPVGRERTRLTSPKVRVSATLKSLTVFRQSHIFSPSLTLYKP